MEAGEWQGNIMKKKKKSATLITEAFTNTKGCYEKASRYF